MSKLFYRYGAMNCGKTTMLLQVAHNYEERGMKILLIKPSIDTKGQDRVVSRLGVERNVDVLLKSEDNIIDFLEENNYPDAIIVDEAQFLTRKQVDELYKITKILSIPVLAYGLRCDFQMNGFPGSIRMLEIADQIEELKTICRCGKKATQNVRFLDGEPVFEGGQVLIDGSSKITYESVCGECYLKYRKDNLKLVRKIKY